MSVERDWSRGAGSALPEESGEVPVQGEPDFELFAPDPPDASEPTLDPWEARGNGFAHPPTDALAAPEPSPSPEIVSTGPAGPEPSLRAQPEPGSEASPAPALALDAGPGDGVQPESSSQPSSAAPESDAPHDAEDRANGTGDAKPVSEAAPNGSVRQERAPGNLPHGFVIAMANQKGGVGKTTTTINLGAALVEEGARVLLVDFDPQGALSVGLGFNPNTLEVTVYDLLLDSSLSFQDIVLSSKFEGLDLLPSNIDLAAAEIVLVNEVAREQMLKRALAAAQEVYNYILIDCPPSLGLLTVNALTAADGVVIPLECEYFALRGMALLLDTIEKVRKRLNPSLEVQGILATMLDRRTLHAREVLSRVSDAFGDKLFETLVHKTIRFAEAPVVGEPILTYAPKSGGADEYRKLAREVMAR